MKICGKVVARFVNLGHLIFFFSSKNNSAIILSLFNWNILELDKYCWKNLSFSDLASLKIICVDQFQGLVYSPVGTCLVWLTSACIDRVQPRWRQRCRLSGLSFFQPLTGSARRRFLSSVFDLLSVHVVETVPSTTLQPRHCVSLYWFVWSFCGRDIYGGVVKRSPSWKKQGRNFPIHIRV